MSTATLRMNPLADGIGWGRSARPTPVRRGPGRLQQISRLARRVRSDNHFAIAARNSHRHHGAESRIHRAVAGARMRIAAHDQRATRTVNFFTSHSFHPSRRNS